jgi:hypothetical protein
MIALSDAKLELKEARQAKRGLSIAPCEPISIRLDGFEMPWEPSGYEGSEKKSACFVVSPEVEAGILRLEAQASGGAGAGEGWNSRIKYGKTGEPILRVKYGDCDVFDEHGQPSKLPDPWRKQTANAVVRVTGVYKSGVGRGLLMECTHLQLKDVEAKPKVNPFA